MANYIICLFLQRLILPLVLVASFLFRPVLLSLPYLLFLFVLPFVPVATIKHIRGGRTGVYFYCLMAVSVLLVLLQIAFHITIACVENFSELLQDCQFLEYLFRHLGFVYLKGLSWQQIVLWIYPEVLMLIASVSIFVALRNLVIGHLQVPQGEEPISLCERPDYDAGLSNDNVNICISIGKMLSIITLLFAAVFHPSAINGIYFVIFLGAATWWACAKELERGFGIVLRVALVIFALHITSFMVYQTPWPQEFLDQNSTVARVLGFTPLVYSKCGNETHNVTDAFNLTTPSLPGDIPLQVDLSNETMFPLVPETVDYDLRVIDFNKFNADYYLNPLCLILCYYTIAITSSLLLGPKIIEEKKRGFSHLENGAQSSVSFRMGRGNILRKTMTGQRWRGAARKVKENVNRTTDETEIEQIPTERTPLMRGGTRKIRDMGTLTPGTVTGDPATDIPMEDIGPKNHVPTESGTSFFEQIAAVTGSAAGFIYQNSYIFTNVVMMTWSIVYHSWFGFVYLLWANLIWIMPNQRMNMLRSSPFLVIYAEILLLINYVYGMDLTDAELPSKVQTKGISLAQIGIIKYREYPCAPLILKSLFTAMFWITLRQMIQEKKAQRKSSALADMVAPLQVTVSPATSALQPKPEPKTSAFVLKTGKIINAFLVKGWIWIVAITLFIFGISGHRMTGFRIIYMALFLFFVITFQLSLRIWRKILYGFWLVVIIYSMIILVLVYTYQFDKFNIYWDMYLSISDTLQKDIGLEKYETKQLFLHLVSPTMIVIITVIQLHYCHKKFLEISEIPQHPDNDQSVRDDSSSIYGGNEASNREETREIQSELNLVDKLKKRKFTKHDLTKTIGHLWKKLQVASEYGWVFLEIHFLKIIMIAAFYLATDHVRFLHILFASVATLGVGCRSRTQVLASKIASLFCSILLILMMIYQIEYIDANSYAYNCHPNNTFGNNSNAATHTVLNNTAIWFGFVKADNQNPLLLLIRPYLIYIVLVTVHAVVTLRQTIHRIRAGQPVAPAKLLFPNIVRKHADKDLPHFIKYMANYGFYKFGIEACLVMLTFVIGKRMDIYALMYAFWLCAMFALTRDKLSKIWNLLKWFLTVAILVQYITFVGLPPRLCIDYPWATTFFDGFRIWALLPDNTYEFRARADILFTDFLLLLFVCRQLIVFRIEFRYKDNPDDFSGGSNQSVLKDLSELGQTDFENPTPDFIEKVRNWLDIIKRGFFLVFFWITLAIVFLAGTNRVNLFSIGYLIGSFAFLWQGTDFYLRPIHIIMKWWNLLIGYTVFVISLKALLQIAGCLYLRSLKTSYCWLVQLLGISCICFPQEMPPDEQTQCNIEMEDVGLLWDGVCFAFLIMQRRVFSSHYFCHIINETKASTILASRGGELIEELRSKEMNLEHEREIQVLEKLKAKMDRIKATQQKLLETAKEPAHHAKDGKAPLARHISLSSYTGYHTPIEDEVATSVLIEGENDIGGLAVSKKESLMVPSPSSAIMTVSLEGYLEPQRFSFSSPPESDHRPSSPDETYPVFSPPPSAAEDPPPLQEDTTQPGGPIYTLMPPPEDGFIIQTGLVSQQKRHRRQSSLNMVQFPDSNELSVSTKLRRSSSNATGEESRRRRQSSLTTSYAQDDIARDRRSSQVTSWQIENLEEDDEEPTISRGTKYRWGAVGERSYRDSIRSTSSRSPLSRSYHESIRSGDYYMFDAVEDEYKLEMEPNQDELTEEEKQTKTGRRLSRKLTLRQLMDKMKREAGRQVRVQEQELARRQSFPTLRQRLDGAGGDGASGVEPRSEPIAPLQFEASTSQAADQTEGITTQPSTSKESTTEEEEMSKLIEEEKTRKIRLKFTGLNLVLKFINSVLVSLTIRLHRVSRNYRFVMRVLAKEKKALKNKPGFGMGLRTGASMVWTPHASSLPVASPVDVDDDTNPPSGMTTPEHDREEQGYQGLGAAIAIIAKKETQPPVPPPLERKESMVPEIRLMAPSLERGLDDDQTEMPSVLEDDYSYESSPVKKLEIGEDEEDFASKEHTIVVELLIACWYAVLSHTDFICYFFVFLNQINSASILSLPLPLLVLLWGTLTFPRPSKTFWITLIAYTQIVVLLKCVSQFDSLWWNQVAVIDADPFAPARIIGIERKKGYATYDLILLLVVFCHRFILKSLGLWKSDFTDDNLHEGKYKAEIMEKGPPKDDEEEKQFIIKQADVSLRLRRMGSDTNMDNAEGVVLVTKTLEEPSNYCPGILKLTFAKYLSSTKAFYRQLIDRRSRKTADVYTFIFLCDFINFFVILFGFSSFGPGGDASVLSYFEENKVPVLFLFMLIIQFFLIVIDRALYLRKYMIGKIIFQFLLIVGLHVWMFFLLPATSERRFNATNPPVIYYLIKCCHLLFSAYQIRCGYPARILGNFITKGYSLLNSIGFKIFMYIPFLFELRTLMDWVWTDTSFSVFDWLKMEDIFSNVFQLKCSRVLEDDLPVPRGQKRKPVVKYMLGGFLVLGLIILIWFPLALFAFSSAVGEPNIPYDVTVSLRIGPYESVYTMSAQDSNIYGLNEAEWNNFMSPYLKDKSALTFLRNYDGVDTAAVVLGANSTTIWNISPPDKERLYLDVIQNKTLTCRFRYTVSRKTHSKEVPGQLSEEKSHVILKDDPVREELSRMLNSSSSEPVLLPLLFPKFIKVRTASMKPAYQLTTGTVDDDDEGNYRNFSIKLHGSSQTGTNSTSWWEVKEMCDDRLYKNVISKLPYSDCNQLVMYLFNDKIFPEGISSVAAGGIVGLYLAFVLVGFWKIRSFVTGQMSKIMFEDLPNVDRVLQLCLDIYLVREANEFSLEEDLFAKLIFLYRSPETLIRWTRPTDEEDTHWKRD